MFDVYRELYYGKKSSVSSVYLWDNEEEDEKDGEGGISGKRGKAREVSGEGFAGCFLIQNSVENMGYWNSIHVVDVGKVLDGKCQYKLTTTILLSITPSEVQSTSISGSLVRKNVRDGKVSSPSDDSGHIINIGRMIEDVESEMRSEMDSLYIQKTRNVVEMIRKERTGKASEGQEHTRVLNEAVLAMAMSRKAKVSGK